MSEPTIDELIDWLESATAEWRDSDTREYDAIRAILEKQRLLESPVERVQLAAIRAFVERVLRRTTDSGGAWNAMLDELVAMEVEVKE